MTASIVAAVMATLGITALVIHHSRHWHRQRQAALKRRHQLIQAQLDRAHDYPGTHDVDGAYRELLELAAGRYDEKPYDWAYDLSPMGQASLEQVIAEERKEVTK